MITFRSPGGRREAFNSETAERMLSPSEVPSGMSTATVRPVIVFTSLPGALVRFRLNDFERFSDIFAFHPQRRCGGSCTGKRCLPRRRTDRSSVGRCFVDLEIEPGTTFRRAAVAFVGPAGML